MSQAELANLVGIKPPAISQYESGARNPSYEVLRKLSYALKVSTEYLQTGLTIKSKKQPVEKSDRVILRVINSLTQQNKEKLVEYAMFLATGRKITLDILFESPSEYANYYLEEKLKDQSSIDIYKLTKELGIKVFDDDLDEGEGLLIQVDHPIILLDNKIKIETRKKFTLATLLGHYIIPWHLKSSYIARKYRKEEKDADIEERLIDDKPFGYSTLLTEEVEEMEAHEFASHILMPSRELKADFIDKNATIETLKKLAYEKYHVSLFVLLNRLVDFADTKYAVVQSQEGKISKVFQGKRTVHTGDVDDKSKAATFFSNPSKKEEIREGEVPASCWFRDAKNNEIVFEQSIYNPEIGRVLTLLTLNQETRSL